MKIGIDYREAIRGNKAGKGWYVWHVVDEWKKIIKDDEVFLFVDQDFEDVLPANWRKVIIKQSGYFWHLSVLWKMRGMVDVYFSPTSYLVPWLDWSGKCVVVVHDLVAFKDEIAGQHNPRAKWIEKMTLKGAMKNARRVIVPSEATKRDLLEVSEINADKVVRVYEGIGVANDKFQMTNDEGENSKLKAQNSKPQLKTQNYDEMIVSLKNKFGIVGDYILFVATLEPRKNLENLILAYKKLLDDRAWQGQLILAGKKGWYYEGLFELVERWNLQEKVIFTGYVTEEEKYNLMRNAECFCYISRYEGFGLPILEAMSVGTPVVTSNVSCLPEIAGNVAKLVNPDDVNDISDSIWQILSDRSLADVMSGRGVERVKEFSWEKAAREIYQLLITNC